jgi:hypothetical protein
MVSTAKVIILPQFSKKYPLPCHGLKGHLLPKFKRDGEFENDVTPHVQHALPPSDRIHPGKQLLPATDVPMCPLMFHALL